uniref:Uncharacterized protein n=1 Tax=Romanomermis culicivorax TaxID=13658 RepID=A0A915JQ50_ROMCU
MFYRFASVGMRAIISKQVSDHEQGQIFAFVALAEGACFLLSSAIFNVFFPFTLQFFAELSFVILAIIAAIPLIGLLYVYRLQNLNRHDRLDVNQ